MKTNTKDWIQYSTAIAMIASAIILTFLDYLMTQTIGQGVLWYVSEALVYAGSIFGVSIYFRTKLGDFESKSRERVKQEMEEITDKIVEKIDKKRI